LYPMELEGKKIEDMAVTHQVTNVTEIVRDAEGYTRLIELSRIRPERMIQVVFDELEQEVGVTQLDGEYVVFRDVCPHMNFPLSVGQIKNGMLICAGHLWRFDLRRNGKVVYPPVNKAITMYEHKAVDGYLWAVLPE
jgi:nitrite reductase/ring-hydroxylating ferredoxin subunit